MMKTCLACRHAQRGEIDRAIVQKVPLRKIASIYGVTKSSLHRHRRRHMERALRKAAQRLEAADGYLGGDIFQRLETLSLLTMNILGRAVAANNLRASNGAIKQAVEHLRFESELLGQLKSGQHNEVRLNVVYGHGARPELLDGRECPTCRRFVNMEEIDRQYAKAIRRSLGLLEEESAAGQTGTGEPKEELPAGVEDEQETIGGFRINRQQPQPQGQVIEAKIVDPTGKPTPVPERPKLPPHQQPNLLGVVVNKSFFDFKKPL